MFETAYPLVRGRLPAAAACILAVALAPALDAQVAAPAPVDAATLARYDRNNNGRLDADERAAMEADQAKAAPVASTTTTSTGDVVELSPFEVSASEDKGYYASNTLSGTRLNSKLEDLGASISVVTKQQMQDFALLDVNDIFLYEAGTEGTGNYTDFVIDRTGAVIDNVQSDPNNANRIRGITSANQARGNFGTSGRVPLDPIDMEAVEISRGPNSNIFGLGNASGTVNIIPSKANLQRAFSTVEARVDSFGGTRGSIDLNRPLWKDKLAVRGSAVFQQDEFEREPSVARSKRYNGMITYRPFKETTLRGSIQYYENFARRPNAILPRDGITYWEQSGSPVWDAAASTVTRNGVVTVVPYNNNQATENTALGAGLESGGSGLYARSSLFIEPDGSIPLWIVGRQSGLDTAGLPTPNSQSGNPRFMESAPPPKLGPLWQTAVSLNDKSRYDWTSINLAAPNWSQNRVRNFTVELEQFFLRTPRNLLGLQLGWMREEADNYNRNFIGQGGGAPMIIYIDVNRTLPDGRANPYFQRPYLNALEPTATRNPYFRDTFREQLAYQLKLSREQNWVRWLGDHSLSGYAEYKNTINAGYRFRDAITDDHAWLAPGSNRANGAAAARGYYRYYIGDASGHDVDSAPPAWSNAAGRYDLNWYNAATGRWVQEPSTLGEVYYQAGNTARTRNVIKTGGGVIQSHFLNDRVVTTFGIRKDSSFSRNSSDTLLSPDGKTIDLVSNRSWPNNWLLREGRTKTSGVVVKPFRGWAWSDRVAGKGGIAGVVGEAVRSLDVFYNRSDSFQPSTIAQNLVGQMLPDPSGKGKDYGFAVSVLNDRLVVRYNQYENTQAKSRFGDSGTIATRAARIDFSNTSGGSDRWNLVRNATEWVTGQNPTWTTAQVATEVAKQMGFPEDQLARMNAYPISDTSDVTAKGKEIEVNFNPNRYYRAKLNVVRQQSVDNHLSPAIMEYINSRLPLWTTIIDPRSNTPWFTTPYGGSTAQDFLNGSVLAPYKLAVANEGRTKSQIREWRVNALGSMQLAALSENKWLQRISVNGAVRWEDRGSIGYYTLPDDPNAYDGRNPIYDKPHTYFDAGATYVTKIYDNRVRLRLQLNVRNLTENGRVQPIGALPNGQPHSFRIIDPRQFILSATFDL